MAWFAWTRLINSQKQDKEKREAAEVQRRLELWQRNRTILKPDMEK